MTKNLKTFFLFLFVIVAMLAGQSANAAWPTWSCQYVAESWSRPDNIYTYQAYGPGSPCTGPGTYCAIYLNGVYDGGVCEIAPAQTPACSDRLNEVFSEGYYDMGTTDTVDPAQYACDETCRTQYSGSGVNQRRQVDGVYHYGAQGMYTFTGESCVAGETASKTSSAVPPDNVCDPATQVQGDINGETVCYAKGETTTETTVDINPTTGDRLETTTVTHPDGSKSITITNTSTDPTTGATSGSTSSSTTPAPAAPPPSSWCVDHPSDITCLAEKAGPIEAAPGSGECLKNPNTLGCARMDGAIGNGDALQTQQRAGLGLIAPVAVGAGGGGTCPAPLVATFLGQSVEFPLDFLCTYATSLRPLVLALAWLSAGLIFIGGVRS